MLTTYPIQLLSLEILTDIQIQIGINHEFSNEKYKFNTIVS